MEQHGSQPLGELTKASASAVAEAERRELEVRRSHTELLLEITRELDHGGDLDDLLHDLLGRVTEASGARRTILVAISDQQADQAFVVGSSDEPSVFGLPASLEAFGEVSAVLRTGQELQAAAIDVNERLAGHSVRTESEPLAHLLVVPMIWEGRAFAALEGHFDAPPDPDRSNASFELLRAIASVLGPRLRHSDAYRSLRDQTQRRSIASVELEMRRMVLDKYKEFFERSADGIVVLDAAGHVLHLNPMGEQITGYAEHGLVGRPVLEIVVEGDRAMVESLVAKTAASLGGQIFDLGLKTTSGDPIVVSVSTSAALADDEMLLLSFRDVTEARALSEELHNTKEFLERLIDSTVDAIVAGDNEGRLILFNAGAERVFQLPMEDVVGKLSLHELYPAGVADRLMEQLRSPEDGGVGRLEMVRKEIVNANDEVIPVRVSASIIYENGEEVGTVAIISDLRERLHIERRLVQAQEKLVDAEKQALLAELAGTTAHELNQPLTSVMGYAELLQRKIPEDDSNHRAAKTILQECQRIADIVRKIGKITKYETTAYVGGQKILDLDKSTQGSEDPAEG